MKIFAIKNEINQNRAAAYLFYYEKKKRFYAELPNDADEWNTPMLLASVLKKNKKTVNAELTKSWVQQRIVPSDRQNIGRILRDNGLKQYDEFELLLLGNGRCAQDGYYIEEVDFDDLPAEIKERRSYKIEDVIPLENNRLLVFFSNGIIKTCDINKISGKNSPLCRLLTARPEAFELVRLQVGGYGVMWEQNMAVSDGDIYENGKTVPLSAEDFRKFVSKRIITSAEAAQMLDCTRQNIDDLVKRGKLIPIKESEKCKWFLKSDIEKRDWF